MSARFKIWLRGPGADGEPIVELIGEQNGDRRRTERSIMAELLPADEARRLEVDEGRWYLPGTPP